MNFWNASADFFVKNQYFPERIRYSVSLVMFRNEANWVSDTDSRILGCFFMTHLYLSFASIRSIIIMLSIYFIWFTNAVSTKWWNFSLARDGSFWRLFVDVKHTSVSSRNCTNTLRPLWLSVYGIIMNSSSKENE